MISYSRIVRIGVVQNSIAADTTAPVSVQRTALHNKISRITEAAALCGVNVLCYQEAWSEYAPLIVYHDHVPLSYFVLHVSKQK